MINDFFRTAIFKSSEGRVLLLKIRLPSLKDGEYEKEFTCAVNSFYRKLCESYMHSADEVISSVGKLAGFYPSPLTFSVSWQSSNESKTMSGTCAFLRRKRGLHRFDGDNCMGFLRTEKLYNREGIIKSREVFDLFDKNLGFLLK